MCEHLVPVETYLKSLGCKPRPVQPEGSSMARNEVLYNCVMDPEALIARFSLPDFVEAFESLDGPGDEATGLVCRRCNTVIAGAHPYGAHAQGLPRIG